MPLVTLRDISLSFGEQILLDRVNLQIEPGERVCLIGRNGAGKSTMLGVIAGDVSTNEGEIQRQPGLRIARLVQDVPQDQTGSVFDLVAAGLGEAGALVQRYHSLIQTLGTDPAAMDELERCQLALEAVGGWEVPQRVETVLDRLELDGDVPVASLSGGLRRRVLLAAALVSEPDLLLLDEPTNHLDIRAIEWLEEFLRGFRGSLLFITHDRAFLRRLATRIVELDRGILSDWPGDYDRYLAAKAAQLESEERNNALFDKRLAQEEVWLRQGIKARRTRNEGRVRALKALRSERAQRRELQGSARLQAQQVERSGKLVAELRNISFSYGGVAVIREFATTILRGDKVGIIGPNGSGKTTLLKLILGELAPTQGAVALGTRLEIAYFDQYRNLIDDNRTVQDNVADGSDTLSINGKPRHVISYLQDFLFSPQRARQPASVLSGGERNRLMLARLFARPANLLVLDEPTNDLDMDTLDLLEELLVDFAGTVLMVSHDRDFIDSVVTSTLVMEGDGRVGEYVGGYADWLRQRKDSASAARAANKPGPAPAASARPAARKRSYREQRELETLPQTIELIEREQAALAERLADPAFYRQDAAEIARVNARVAELAVEIEALYARWESLDAE
jgi:ABC transport system ATP-binding/permease protein